MSTKREIAARLREAREAAGFRTAKEFSDKHDIPQNTYSMHETGTRGLKTDVAAKYAKALGITVDWLVNGLGDGPPKQHPPPPPRNYPGSTYGDHEAGGRRPFGPSKDGGRDIAIVQVVGAVEAGAWREAYQWPEDDWKAAFAPPGPYAPEEMFGLEVRGPSMNKVIPEGSVVLCVSLFKLRRSLRSGDIVVVERHRAGLVEATLKELVAERDGRAVLWPRSTDPRYQEPIPLPSDGLPWGLAEGPASFVSAGELDEAAGEIKVTAVVVGDFRWRAWP